VSSTPLPEALPLERLLSRPVLISGAALIAATVLAWAWLFLHPMPNPMESMGGMSEMPGTPEMRGTAAAPDPWSLAYLAASFTMWTLMMVAMMLPSAGPMILLHARIDRGTQAQRIRDNLLFVLCYLAVWTVFSALAALSQSTLVAGAFLSSTTLELRSGILTAGLLFGAAVWQLTSAKTACLEQCQSPLQFVMRHWRPGAAGAVRLGVRHGLYCLGCCWSLMLLLFVGGVMNLAWIAGLAVLVFVEKVTPFNWRADRWIAGVLMLGSIALIVPSN
jgi:predicted metal-binding membrane protein